MVYAFINSEMDVINQRKSILEKVFEINSDVDIWLEGNTSLLQGIVEQNLLNRNDILLFENVDNLDFDSLLLKIKTLCHFNIKGIHAIAVKAHLNLDLFENVDIYNSFSKRIKLQKNYKTKRIVSIEDLLKKNIPINTICRIFDLKRNEVKQISAEIG